MLLPSQPSCETATMTGRMKSVAILRQRFDKNIVKNEFATAAINSQDIVQTQSLTQIARYRFDDKYGMRYYILIFCIIFYALLGGIIFHATEHHDEIQYVEANVNKLNVLISDLTGRISNVANVTLTRKRQSNVHGLIK